MAEPVYCGNCRFLDEEYGYHCVADRALRPKPSWYGPRSGNESADPEIKNQANNCPDYRSNLWGWLYQLFHRS